MILEVVVDLSGSMEGSALFFYNKVSTDFANWMKTITFLFLLTNNFKRYEKNITNKNNAPAMRPDSRQLECVGRSDSAFP